MMFICFTLLFWVILWIDLKVTEWRYVKLYKKYLKTFLELVDSFTAETVLITDKPKILH
jgi:hypothetical protein